MRRAARIEPWRLGVLALALILAWLSVTTGLAGIARTVRPSLALAVSGNDARALVNQADALARADLDGSGLKRAAVLAHRALERDATSAAALRILALAAPAERQRPMFSLAERMNKRDLATQLWLIEDAVARNRIPDALQHYDIALRTNAVAAAILFPILSHAIENSDITAALVGTLARKPPWSAAFLYEAVNSSPSVDNLVRLFYGLKRKGYPLDPALAQNLVTRTISGKRYDLTRSAYLIAGGKNRDAGQAIADGGFSDTGSSPPFGWEFASSNNITTEKRMADDGRNMRLTISASGSGANEAARQLLLLHPGSYSLATTVGDRPSGSGMELAWVITCAGNGALIGRVPIMDSGSPPGRHVGSFIVPTTGCEAQWLILSASSDGDGGSPIPWVDDVVLSASR